MTPQQRIAFFTLGCKLNFSESSTIARKMEDHGYAPVDFEEVADIYVINTCSVTDHADRKCKRIVKRALASNPEAYVVIIGCYAQLKPEEISQIEGVDLVLGAKEKFNLAEHLKTLEKGQKTKVETGAIKEVKEFRSGYSFGDRTRSFLKVQDGCNYFCSFCTIPLARGVSRSDYIENIVANAEELAQKGVREIVLTGVNIGDFSNDRNENFYQLICELDKVEGIDRFRISSIEPNLLEDRIIEFVSTSQRFVPHFHIPLQSGCDEILKSMRRRYTTTLYRQRIEKIKNLIPECCIGVDVLTGYPGEGEKEFMETFDFLQDLDISYIHPFPYSERPNTPAAKRQNQVQQSLRTERRKMLQNLSAKKLHNFYRQFEGQLKDVLFESSERNGKMQGLTGNYLRVSVPYQEENSGKILPVELSQLQEGTIFEGTLLDEPATLP